ncbi:MAG: hypothetical protein L6R39_004293, partial [Caloplaca ligustica]
MADALSSLERTLALKKSDESFHSSHSQQPSVSPGLSNTATDVHAAALKAAGLPIYDVEAYLNDPRNQEALNSLPVNSPSSKKQKGNVKGPSSANCTPVQLGAPKTSHNVTGLVQLCQERGLVAEFEIEGDQPRGFGGAVTVGEETIASEQRWPSKKEAKEGLAELALPVAREMEAVVKKGVKGGKGEQQKNWLGMLLEYHNATDPTTGAVYTEYALGLQFAATCTIPSSPGTTFGSDAVPFPSKKAARANAAKEAVQHLISIGELNPDGSVKARRKIGGGGKGPTVTVEAKGVEVKKDATYAARVN